MNDPTTTPEMKLSMLQSGENAYSGSGLELVLCKVCNSLFIFFTAKKTNQKKGSSF